MITVIIPAYNQSQYLRLAVDSVLAQSRQDFEVVIVDDGSTDDTAAVAKSISDPRVKYVYQANRGLSGARNTGMRHSSGEFVTFLDSDDLLLPQKHAILAARLEAAAQVGLVSGTTVIIDENGRRFGKPFEKPLPDQVERLLLGNPMQVCSVMVRRQWLERAGEFDESLRAYEDWDMYLRLGKLGCQMAWVPDPVSMYRFHTQQMNRDRERMTTATFAVLDNFFAREAIPPAWLALKDLAYSNAYLRSAIHAYRAADMEAGRADLDTAVRLDPQLAAQDGAVLAERLSALVDSPKVIDKLGFLEQIYASLPPSLAGLQRRRRAHLGRYAAEQGFDAHRRGDPRSARQFLLRAARYQPAWLLNRGVLSILFRPTPSQEQQV